MGASSKPGSRRIVGLVRRDDTIVRLAGQGNGWYSTWAADDRQYMSLNGGAGFEDQSSQFFYSRLLAVSGGPEEPRFHDVPGYPSPGIPPASDAPFWGYGVLAVGSRLYLFLSTSNDPAERGAALGFPWRFVGAKLVFSDDGGRTWRNQDGTTPVRWVPWGERSRDDLVFYEEPQDTFSLPSVLQMGRGYEHNRDGYVYVYSPNGQTEGTMNELVMFRVSLDRVLDRASYEYFAGSDAGVPQWSSHLGERAVVHTFPAGWVNTWMHPVGWQPSIVYNAPLGIYMMANWSSGSGHGVDESSGRVENDMWFTKPSYLGFWVSKTPWGPWDQIHEEIAWTPDGDLAARCFHAQIPPKWISSDGSSFWLVWSDYQVSDAEGLRRAMPKSDDPNDASEVIQALRAHMPHYGFNAQRVDLVIK